MWAFVDEYGTPSLDIEVQGVTRWYIFCAVLVGDEAIDGLRVEVEAVRRRHFQAGEMKSKGLGPNGKRWNGVLSSLPSLPFQFAALVVDKAKIDQTTGLSFKNTFVKNVQKRLYEKLFRAHAGLKVRADSYGRENFREGFKTYLEKQHGANLFDRRSFEYVESSAEVLVQLADIVCGALARTFVPGLWKSPLPLAFAPLAQKALVIDHWPRVPWQQRFAAPSDVANVTVDDRISAYAIRQAEDFVERNEMKQDHETECKVAVVNRLLLQREFAPDVAVSASELLGNLSAQSLEPKGMQWFRSKVIGSLRDSGVVITSSAHGYALPATRQDLMGFVEHAQNICTPLLGRVKAACDAIKLTTSGDVDVLGDAAFADAAALIQAIAAPR